MHRNYLSRVLGRECFLDVGRSLRGGVRGLLASVQSSFRKVNDRYLDRSALDNTVCDEIGEATIERKIILGRFCIGELFFYY